MLAVALASFGGVLIGASVCQLGYLNPFALVGDVLIISGVLIGSADSKLPAPRSYGSPPNAVP